MSTFPLTSRRLLVTLLGFLLVLTPFLYTVYLRPGSASLIPLVAEESAPAPRAFHRVQSDYEELDYTKIVYDTGVIDPHRPLVLVLSSVGDSESYGKDRLFPDFYKTIISQINDGYTFSLGLLFGNHEELERVDGMLKDIVNPEAISKVTLIYAPFLEKQQGFDRIDRQQPHVQRKRRRSIARARNFLLYNALEDQTYTFFLDSDVVSFELNNTLDIFIKSGLDIVVPRVTRGTNNDYDKNTWRGVRIKPLEEQLKMMDEGRWDEWDRSFMPQDVKPQMWHFGDFLLNKDGERDGHEDDIHYHVPLDSVGGAVLFAKSIIYKQGVVFPASYIIGTEWGREEGYDGIETEGVCYLARPLGYKCWAYPNIVAHHSNW